MNVIKKLFCVILMLVFLPTALFATWAMISLDKLVADTDLIVIGTLHSASENSEGIGRGYILVDEIVTKGDDSFEGQNTLDGHRLRPTDNLKLTWEDNWACAAGMHRGWEGKRGLWLLKVQNGGTVEAGYPGRFRALGEVDEVRQLINRKHTSAPPVLIDQYSRSNESQAVLDKKVVDITPFNEYSPFGSAIVLLFASGLYWILYKSRFRIR